MKTLAIVAALLGSMVLVNSADATGRRVRLLRVRQNQRAQVVVNVNDARNDVQEIRVLKVQNYVPANRVEIRVR